MKVLMINCSPHKKGSTDRALNEIAAELNKADIASEIYQLPLKPLQSCTACGYCREHEINRCTIDDCVNEILEKVETSTALVVGSPVHFAGITGSAKTVLDRLFYCARPLFYGKPYVGIVIARRAGTTSALEQLNKYPIIADMYQVGGTYWPMVFGNNAAEIEKDEEGMENLRTIAANLAWFLKTQAEARELCPQPKATAKTNFIR